MRLYLADFRLALKDKDAYRYTDVGDLLHEGRLYGYEILKEHFLTPPNLVKVDPTCGLNQDFPAPTLELQRIINDYTAKEVEELQAQLKTDLNAKAQLGFRLYNGLGIEPNQE